MRIPAWIIGAVAGLTICSSASTGRGQQDAGALEILQLRRNFYLLATPISNVGVQIGSDGVVKLRGTNHGDVMTVEKIAGDSVGTVKFLRDARGAVSGFTVNRDKARGIRFDRVKPAG